MCGPEEAGPGPWTLPRRPIGRYRRPQAAALVTSMLWKDHFSCRAQHDPSGGRAAGRGAGEEPEMSLAEGTVYEDLGDKPTERVVRRAKGLLWSLVSASGGKAWGTGRVVSCIDVHQEVRVGVQERW